jgi:hypothetical protein
MYCPKFENHRRELFSNVLNYNAAILSADDKFVWILSNEDPSSNKSNIRNTKYFIKESSIIEH